MRSTLSRLSLAAIGTALAAPVLLLSLVRCHPHDPEEAPVTAPADTSSAEVDYTKGTLTLSCGDTLCLPVLDSAVLVTSRFLGSGGVSVTVASDWSVSDGTVAHLTPVEGGQRARVMPLRKGTATITAHFGPLTASSTLVTGPVPPESVSFTQTDTLVLSIGQTSRVTASVTPALASGFSWIWAIDSPTPLASLSFNAETALLTAVGEGSGEIIVRAGSASARRPLRVLSAASSEPGVESILLDKNEITLSVGQSDTIRAYPVPSGTPVDDWTWSCLGTGAIRLASEGGTAVVTALRDGKETVSVRAGSASASLPVSVTTVEATPDSIAIEPSVLTIEKGGRKALSLRVRPEGFPFEASEVLWTVDDPSVVLVENVQGCVELIGLSDGVTSVRASYRGCGASVRVTVLTALDALYLYPPSVTLYEGQTGSLKAESRPEGFSVPSGAWTSETPSVVTVTGDGSAGASLTALATGRSRVSVSAGGRTATASVTVRKPLQGVALNATELDMTPGQTLQLSAVRTPEGAWVESTEWDSTNPAAVYVEKDGTVRALGEGEAVVTCRLTSRETYAASVAVTVTPPAGDLSLDFSIRDVFDVQTPSVALAFGPTPVTAASPTLSATLDGSPVAIAQPDWTPSSSQTLVLPSVGIGQHVARFTVKDAYGRTLQSTSLPFTVRALPQVSFLMRPDDYYATYYGTSDAVCLKEGEETYVCMLWKQGEVDTCRVVGTSTPRLSLRMQDDTRFFATGWGRGQTTLDVRLTKGTAAITKACPVIVFSSLKVQPYFERHGFNRDSFRLGLYVSENPVTMLKASVTVYWHLNACFEDGRNAHWDTTHKTYSGYLQGETDIQWEIDDILAAAESKLAELGRELTDVATLYVKAQCEWTFDNPLVLVRYEETRDSYLNIFVEGKGLVKGVGESLHAYQTNTW